MSVRHLTAELAPMPGGIADYVAILGGGLAAHGLRQRYLVTGGKGGRPADPALFADRGDVAILDEHSPAALAEVLRREDPRCVLLHYSGYGFARRGAPLWLVRGLERRKRQRPEARLVVMFHETWAGSDNPLRSSFWISSLQRSCVRQIAQLADAVVTSNDFYAKRLQPLVRPGTPVRVQPILSNVGEPETVPSFGEREPACVVFGRGGHRRRVWQRFQPHFSRLARLGIERIVEIGTEPEATADLKWPVPCERLGPLPAAEVSDRLLRARFGLFECPAHIACKSGVFVALAAHGVVPVSPDGRGVHDGFAHGLWSICLGEGPQVDPNASDCAFRWYQPNRLEGQVGSVWAPLMEQDRAACASFSSPPFSRRRSAASSA